MTDYDGLLDVLVSAQRTVNERLTAARALIASGNPTRLARVLEVLTGLQAALDPSDSTTRARIGVLMAAALRAGNDRAAGYGQIRGCIPDLATLDPADGGLGLALVVELSVATGQEGDAVERLQAAGPTSAAMAADVAMAICTLLESSGRIDEALEHLRLARRSPEITDPIAAQLARVTGVLLEKKGRLAEALGAFEEAARLAGSDTDFSRALTLQSLAVGYLDAGRLDDAARAADRALAAAEVAESDHASIGALIARGNVCAASGQHRLAIRHFHAALLAQARTGLRSAEILLLNNIASSYGRLGQVHLAVTYQMWALDSSMELRDLPNKALALTSLAGWRDPEEGRIVYTEAFQIYTELDDLPGQAAALLGMARCCERLAEAEDERYLLEDAAYFLAMARERAEAMNDLELVGTVHATAAGQAAKSGDAEQAWAHYQRWWATAESLRHLTEAEAVRLRMSEDMRSTIADTLSLAMTSADNATEATDAGRWRERLFAMVERSRARVLVDRLAVAAPLDNQLPLQQREELSALAAEVRRRREALIAHVGADPADVERLRHDLMAAHQNFTDLQGFLTQSHRPYRLLASTEPIEGPMLDRHLGTSTGLIEYAAVDGTLISLVRAHGRVTLYQHGELTEISALDRELTSLCQSRSDLRRAQKLSRTLYDRLLRPIEAAHELAGLTDLIVVPAPEVFGFPVEALVDDGGYVFERFLVTYLPAASVAPFLADPDDGYEPALILADPDGSLGSAHREVNTIKDLFRLTADGQPFEGPRATAAQLSTWASSARLIHVAAHADFDPVAPSFSTIRLAPGDGSSSGTFEVDDVLNLRLKPCLVVLSGCDTGRGSTEGANEMIGFIRAFMVSGAAAVVASRWPVADPATSKYMHTFYRALTEDRHPALAMRQARWDQIHRNRYAHPGYWASFTCFGLPPAWLPAQAMTGTGPEPTTSAGVAPDTYVHETMPGSGDHMTSSIE